MCTYFQQILAVSKHQYMWVFMLQKPCRLVLHDEWLLITTHVMRTGSIPAACSVGHWHASVVLNNHRCICLSLKSPVGVKGPRPVRVCTTTWHCAGTSAPGGLAQLIFVCVLNWSQNKGLHPAVLRSPRGGGHKLMSHLIIPVFTVVMKRNYSKC